VFNRIKIQYKDSYEQAIIDLDKTELSVFDLCMVVSHYENHPCFEVDFQL